MWASVQQFHRVVATAKHLVQQADREFPFLGNANESKTVESLLRQRHFRLSRRGEIEAGEDFVSRQHSRDTARQNTSKLTGMIGRTAKVIRRPAKLWPPHVVVGGH